MTPKVRHSYSASAADDGEFQVQHKLYIAMLSVEIESPRWKYYHCGRNIITALEIFSVDS